MASTVSVFRNIAIAVFAPLQQSGEEFLGQVLGFLELITFSPNENVKGFSAGAAKRLERCLCRRRPALRGQDHTPVGRDKRHSAVLRGRWCGFHNWARQLDCMCAGGNREEHSAILPPATRLLGSVSRKENFLERKQSVNSRADFSSSPDPIQPPNEICPNQHSDSPLARCAFNSSPSSACRSFSSPPVPRRNHLHKAQNQ